MKRIIFSKVVFRCGRMMQIQHFLTDLYRDKSNIYFYGKAAAVSNYKGTHFEADVTEISS